MAEATESKNIVNESNKPKTECVFCGEMKNEHIYGQLGIGYVLYACSDCLLGDSYFICSLCGVLTSKKQNGKPEECLGEDPFISDFHRLKRHKWVNLTQVSQLDIYQC